MKPRTATAATIHTAVRNPFGAVAGRAADGNVCSVAIVSVLTKAIDEMGIDPVRIELPRHQVASTHPGPAGPLPERDPGPGCAGRGGKHLHALEGLLHAAGAQGTGVGEGAQERGGDVPVHHRDAVLRATPV